MASKKTRNIGLRVSDEEKAELERLAAAEGITVSAYLLRRGGSPPPYTDPGGAPAMAPPAASSPAADRAQYVCHVDDLGPDTLRNETGALKR